MLTQICLKQALPSYNNTMNKNILTKFSKTFTNATDMWNKLSTQYEDMEKRDPEFHGGLKQLAETIEKFNEVTEMVTGPDGLNVEEMLKLLAEKKRKESDEENYPFVLFVILKNLEYTGMIKMFNRPERIAKSAMAAYGKKRTAKK